MNWAKLTGHFAYWLRHAGWGMYVYDEADDGPEVKIIKAILVRFPELDPSLPGRIRR